MASRGGSARLFFSSTPPVAVASSSRGGGTALDRRRDHNGKPPTSRLPPGAGGSFADTTRAGTVLARTGERSRLMARSSAKIDIGAFWGFCSGKLYGVPVLGSFPSVGPPPHRARRAPFRCPSTKKNHGAPEPGKKKEMPAPGHARGRKLHLAEQPLGGPGRAGGKLSTTICRNVGKTRLSLRARTVPRNEGIRPHESLYSSAASPADERTLHSSRSTPLPEARPFRFQGDPGSGRPRPWSSWSIFSPSRVTLAAGHKADRRRPSRSSICSGFRGSSFVGGGRRHHATLFISRRGPTASASSFRLRVGFESYIDLVERGALADSIIGSPPSG